MTSGLFFRAEAWLGLAGEYGDRVLPTPTDMRDTETGAGGFSFELARLEDVRVVEQPTRVGEGHQDVACFELPIRTSQCPDGARDPGQRLREGSCRL